MKKRILLLIFFMFPIIANAYTGSSGMSYQDCKAFADNYKNISGSYEYKSCYRAGCSTSGTWTLANMGTSTGYSCANGNPEPYYTVSDGCAQFVGACTINSGYYCTTVKAINCNKKKDGSAYEVPTTTKTTTTTTTTTAKITTSTTTKKTTTKTTRKSTISKSVAVSTTDPWFTEPTTEPTTEAVLSNNTNISKIVINGTDLYYNSEISEYNLPVEYGLTSVDIYLETEDSNAFYEVYGNENMPDEDTDILLTVKAPDGSERNIIVHVKRYHALSKDCSLEYIKINNASLKNYKKDNYKYTLKIDKNKNVVDIDTMPSDTEHATFEVIGNSDLKNKSVINISVTAESGDVCSYKITIKKPSGIWLPLIIIIAVVGLLIAGGYYIYGYFKRSKDMYKYE